MPSTRNRSTTNKQFFIFIMHLIQYYLSRSPATSSPPEEADQGKPE